MPARSDDTTVWPSTMLPTFGAMSGAAAAATAWRFIPNASSSPSSTRRSPVSQHHEALLDHLRLLQRGGGGCHRHRQRDDAVDTAVRLALGELSVSSRVAQQHHAA